MPAIRMAWLALSNVLFRLCMAARAERPCRIFRPLSNELLQSGPGYASPCATVPAQIGRMRHPHQHNNVWIDGVSHHRPISGGCIA